jgi:hypothetical protein
MSAFGGKADLHADRFAIARLIQDHDDVLPAHMPQSFSLNGPDWNRIEIRQTCKPKNRFFFQNLLQSG